MFKTYKKGLDRWSTLSQSAEDYMRQFYYDTALSTGESAFASLRSNGQITYFIWFRCTLCPK